MNRFEKAQREEELWQFSQRAGLFEGVFSRRIFGPLWWWWLFVVYFLSILLTTEQSQPFRRSFYFAAFRRYSLAWVFTLFSGLDSARLCGALSRDEKRADAATTADAVKPAWLS